MTAKQLKITGEIILILSFVTQTLLFDYYNDKSESLRNTSIAHSLVDKGAELRELKYFAAKLPNDSLTQADYQRLNIQSAALKLAYAKIVQYTQLDTPKHIIVDMGNSLIQASYKVNDFYDYMNFIDFLNSRDVSAHTISNLIEGINNRKEIYRWIFLLLYITGATFLVFASIREKSK